MNSALVSIKKILKAGLPSAVALSLASCAGGGWRSAAPDEVWLLLGQSNMSGRGDLADLPAEFSTPGFAFSVMTKF